MSQQQLVMSLEARHRELELAIEKEAARPLPDSFVVQMLKRQKLRIKDKLYHMTRH